MKYELRQMREQGSGAIVNNSSIGGLIGIAGRAAYHASKHGVIGLTKSAAFEPGARTAWHTHPLGQTLIVTAGTGLTQMWGGPIEEIQEGDVVWCPPGEKHWHGATPTTAMTHIAIVEKLDGKVVEWMEKVSDEQYQA